MSDPSAETRQAEAEDEAQRQMLQAALRSPLPRFYANGFGIAQTNADVSVIMITNGQASGVLSMSYISAKNLITELAKAVKMFEGAIGREIMSVDEISERMKRVAGEPRGKF